MGLRVWSPGLHSPLTLGWMLRPSDPGRKQGAGRLPGPALDYMWQPCLGKARGPTTSKCPEEHTSAEPTLCSGPSPTHAEALGSQPQTFASWIHYRHRSPSGRGTKLPPPLSIPLTPPAGASWWQEALCCSSCSSVPG